MRFLNVIKSRQGLPVDFKKIEPEIEKFAKKYNLLLIYIFGSYAYEMANKLSDVDIAILRDGDLSNDKKLEIIADLTGIFKDEAIDLVDLKQAPLVLTHRILKYGKCLFSSSLEARINFESLSETMYMDTKPIRDEYFRALERRLSNGTFGDR